MNRICNSNSVSAHSPKPKSMFPSSPTSNSTSTSSFDSASPTDHSRRRYHWLKGNSVTLADHIGNDKLRDREEEEHPFPRQNETTTSVFSTYLRKQRSCREFNFNTSDNNSSSKENHQPTIGRSTSTRYRSPENSLSPVKKASNSISRSYSSNNNIVSRRVMSLDNDDSWLVKKLVIKRANSLTGGGGCMSSMSQWALSPGRSGSPPMSVESKVRPFSFSSFRPPNKGGGVDKILTMGLHLFRSKKKSSSTTSSQALHHHLRLLHNRLLQWRFANAKARAVNHTMSPQAQSNMIYALDGLTKLQHSVLQKKMRLERQRLQMKLGFVLQSQTKLLEAWGDMERRHLAAMKECLHSVVCKVPLLEGAKVDIQLATIAQRHASDLTASIESMLSSFSPSAHKIARLLSELAEVVAQEKLLLEEFYNLFRTMCVLELKERSLKCSLIQLKC